MPTDTGLYELKAEIKELAEDGSFTGIASAYGVEDLTGDIIDKGAFTKTLQESPRVPVLWQHQSAEVIGDGEVKEWQGKILINGKLDLEDPMSAKAYGKMKRRLVKGLSIGFQTVKSTWEEIEGRMVRHITELKLYEVSVVTFAALSMAQVTRVKSQDEHNLEARISKLEAAFSAISAKTSEGAGQATPPDGTSTPSGAAETATTGTPQGAAAEPSEPGQSHSAAKFLDAIEGIRSLIPA